MKFLIRPATRSPVAEAGKDAGLQAAIDAAGSLRTLARLLGISVASVGEWRCVPKDRILEIELGTGVPRHKLRPDLFPPPT